jgi:hypothetical protein
MHNTFARLGEDETMVKLAGSLLANVAFWRVARRDVGLPHRSVLRRLSSPVRLISSALKVTQRQKLC